MKIKLVRESINRDYDVNESTGEVLKIHDLAEIVSRTGNDYETLLSIFQDMFQKEGDTGVIKLFKSATDLDLENLSHGHYTIKY